MGGTQKFDVSHQAPNPVDVVQTPLTANLFSSNSRKLTLAVVARTPSKPFFLYLYLYVNL